MSFAQAIEWLNLQIGYFGRIERFIIQPSTYMHFLGVYFIGLLQVDLRGKK